MKAAPWGRRRQKEPDAASPVEATAGSAGRSLLSGPAQRPIPTANAWPPTLWILFRAMVGNGGDGPRGGDGDGGGTGKGRGGLRPPWRSRVDRRRPGAPERGSDELRAEAHSAYGPAAAVTASPGGGPFMRCCHSRRRRSCLFLVGSAPPPRPPWIPPPGRKSPKLRARLAPYGGGAGEACFPAWCRWTKGRTGGRRRRGGAARARGGPRPRSRSGGSGIGGLEREGRAAPAAEGYGPPLRVPYAPAQAQPQRG